MIIVPLYASVRRQIPRQHRVASRPPVDPVEPSVDVSEALAALAVDSCETPADLPEVPAVDLDLDGIPDDSPSINEEPPTIEDDPRPLPEADPERFAAAPAASATISELVDWVDGDPDRAEFIRDRESDRKDPRPRLLLAMSDVITSGA